MSHQASNCIVCAEEFDSSTELRSTAASKLNTSNFKICDDCLDKSDPADDYREARSIINSYLKMSEVKVFFAEAKGILSEIKK